MNPLAAAAQLLGFEVFLDQAMVDRKWIFPADRFVEYGTEDEGWARSCGFGHEEVVPQNTIIRRGNAVYMHPTLLERLKLAMANQEKIYRGRIRAIDTLDTFRQYLNGV